jgi:hypothetical protein
MQIEQPDFEQVMTAPEPSVSMDFIHEKEQEFFEKKFYYSYSSLNKLLWNPQTFYQMYVLGQKEERLDAHLVQGKLIHLLLLEPEKLAERFIVSPSNLPTGNSRTVVDRVFRHHMELKQNGHDMGSNLSDYEGAILDVMTDMNYFQNLKSDQQRLDKIITPDTLSYWEFLQNKGDKTLVDLQAYEFCEKVVDLVKQNQEICQLIGQNTTDFDNRKVMNEVEVKLDLPNASYGLKGIIDNIVVDHDLKVIRINDIKTTSKDLKDFPESVEYYAYWLQAVIYMIMAGQMFFNEINSGYKLEFRFIVIDRTYQTYAFPVTDTTLSTWLEKFKKTMEVAKWHFSNKDYSLPYEFAIGLVSL